MKEQAPCARAYNSIDEDEDWSISYEQIAGSSIIYKLLPYLIPRSANPPPPPAGNVTYVPVELSDLRLYLESQVQ